MSTVIKPYISRQDMQGNPYQRYLYNLMRSGKAKTKEWLTENIMSGRIVYHFFSAGGSQSIKQFTSENSRRMFLESLLGYTDKIGELHEWDMHVHIKYLDDVNTQRRKPFLVLSPMLKFDHITIENSDGNSHDIEELFVFFQLQVTCIKDGKMVLRPSIPEGMRTLFHEDEYNSRYIHSHLYEFSGDTAEDLERDVRTLRTFCIGNDEQEEFISLLGANYDPHLFIRFLMIIRTMVEWESLEGVPFKHINEIHSRDTSSDESSPGESSSHVRMSAYPLFSRLPEYIDSLDFTIQENHYEIKLNREFEERMKEILIEEGQHNFIAKRTNRGWVSYNAEQAELFITDAKDEVFIFGSHEYKLRLHGQRDQDENHDDINSYRIYPKFLNYVKQQISVQLYHHQISGGFLRAEN